MVGGVAGGMSAATRLRRLVEDAEIVVFEQGPHVSYANCGLPYHIGEVIENESDLLLQTPKSLQDRFRLDVRIDSRVTSIDSGEKRVHVLNLKTGESYSEDYDSLILATGAKPRRLSIPGIERAHVLRDVQDAVNIKKLIDDKKVRSAAIIGAGFIGVELAENLRHREVITTLISSQETILTQFDAEIIEPMQAEISKNGVHIELNAQTEEVLEDSVRLKGSKLIPADLVVVAAGVVADHQLAIDAGLRIGEAGGIWVNDQMQTSDPAIYAVGDAAEKNNMLTGSAQMIWLANLANRHGRLVADVIAGEGVAARPAIGTGIVGAFGMVAAMTGLTESLARRTGVDYQVIHLHPGSHAGYYPGAERLSLKVLFEPETGKILGAQASGRDGVDKRIDVIATAIYAGLTVDDLMNLELAYAPAFGSAKDAINQAGYVGNNARTGRTPSIQWHEVSSAQANGSVVVDVRTPAEHESGTIPGSVLIPLDQLRERLHDLVGKDVITTCAVGQRGHSATQILRQHGIKAINLDGGYTTWRSGVDAIERASR